MSDSAETPSEEPEYNDIQEFEFESHWVRWFDVCMNSDSLTTLNEVAKALGGGRQRLLARLRELEVFMSVSGAQGNGALPYQEYVGRGWFEVVMEPVENLRRPVPVTRVTPRGVSGVYRLLTEQGTGNGTWRLPLTEDELLAKVFPGEDGPFLLEVR